MFSTKASVVGSSACILGAEVAVFPNFVAYCSQRRRQIMAHLGS